MGFPKIGVEMVVEGYDDFQSKLGKMGKGIAGVGKAAGKIALGGMAILGTATIALGAAFIKLASDAASLEGIRDAFAGIAESAGTSQEAMLAALQKGSLGMVTQRDLMATFNEAAQLVGVTFAQQLPDAFGFLSKVSAATGQDMGFMIDSLVKGVGRMSPMILDNLGIQVTLADATANAAAQFGVEADELSKTQLQAGMMNVVLEKLAENTAAMPEVAGTAAQAQAAFGVALADTKDAIGLALLPTFTKLMTAVTAFATENLPKLVAAFEQHIVPAIETVVNWLGKELPGAIQTLSTFLTKAWEQHIKPVLMTFMKFLSQTIPPIVNGVRKLITTVFGDIVDWVGTNLPKIQDTILTVMNAIRTAVGTALDAIAGFWETHGKKILGAVENTWNSIKTLIETAIDVIKGIIEAAMQIISGDWEGAWDTIKDVIATIWEGIGDVIENTFNTLKDTIIPIALDAIEEAIKNAWEPLKEWVKTTWENIKTTIKDAWDKLKDETVPGALGNIETAIKNAWNSLKEWVKRKWDEFKTAITNTWNALKNEVIPQALDAIKAKIHNAWDSLKEWIKTTWSNIKETVKDVWRVLTEEAIPAALDGIKEVIKNAWTSLKEWIKTTWENIKDKVKDVWDVLMNEAIPAGLEGIKLAIVAAWNWLKDTFVPDAWEGIKTAISDVWDALVNVVIPIALDTIEEAIKIAWNWLKDTFVPGVWDGIKMAIKLVWFALTKTVIPTALGKIEEAIKTAFNYLKDTVIPTIWGAIGGVIETAWETITQFVQDGVDALPDIIKSVAQAMYDAGTGIIKNLWDGMKQRWQEMIAWFKERLQDLADLLPSFSEPKDASSPLYGLGKAGAAIVTNLIEGMDSALPALMDMGHLLGEALIGALTESLEEGERLIDQLFDVGGELGGIGGVILGRFEEQTLKPMKSELDAITDKLKDQSDVYDDLTKRQMDIQDILGETGDLNQLLLQYEFDRGALTEEQIGRITQLKDLMRERAGLAIDMALTEEEQARAAAEYAAAQERALALEQARADLKFLEAQMDLLDLIAEHELDPDAILGGMELGLDANLEDLLAAMTAAMQEIIAAAEEELEAESPSAAFARLGEQMMAGMAMGIEDMANLPIRASLLAAQQTISIPALLGSTVTTSNVTTENNPQYHLGGNTINSGMDQAQFEARVLRIVRRDAKT